MASGVAALCCSVKLASTVVDSDPGVPSDVNACCAPSRPYVRDCKRALEDPDDFWAETAARLTWYRKWDKVLDLSKKPRANMNTDGTPNETLLPLAVAALRVSTSPTVTLVFGESTSAELVITPSTMYANAP
ncbi:hypothetical protein MRX96_025633 [Rhipicephalus microplus]